jgi:hypothetical protein
MFKAADVNGDGQISFGKYYFNYLIACYRDILTNFCDFSSTSQITLTYKQCSTSIRLIVNYSYFFVARGVRESRWRTVKNEETNPPEIVLPFNNTPYVYNKVAPYSHANLTPNEKKTRSEIRCHVLKSRDGIKIVVQLHF